MDFRRHVSVLGPENGELIPTAFDVDGGREAALKGCGPRGNLLFVVCRNIQRSFLADSFASQQIMVLDFRNGSGSVIPGCLGHVRYSPESGSPAPTRAGRERANTGPYACIIAV